MPGKDLKHEEKEVYNQLMKVKRQELENETAKAYPNISPSGEELPTNLRCKARLINMRNESMRRISKHHHKKLLSQYSY